MGVAGSATVSAGSFEFITATRDPHSRYATNADRNSGSPGSPISSGLSSSRFTPPPPLRLRNIFPEVMRQHGRVPAAAHSVGLRSSQHLAQNPPRVADGPPACRQTEAAATRRRTLARGTSPSRRSAAPLHPATHTTRESDFLFRSRDSLSFLRLGTILPPSLPSSWDLASASLPGRLTGQAPFLRSLL
jgi:hypothetical protein